MTTNKPYTFDRVVRRLLAVGVAVGAIALVGYIADILIPLVIGILLAYLLDPIVQVVNKRIKNHSVAVLLTVILMLGTVTSAITLTFPVVAGEFRTGVALVRDVFEPGSNLRKKLDARLPPGLADEIGGMVWDEDVQAFLKDNSELQSFMVAGFKKVVPRLWGVVSGALSVLAMGLQAFLILLYLIFILMDYRKFRETWPEYLPPQIRENVVALVEDFNGALSAYFRGQFVIASIVGLLFAVGFSLIGLRMAILLGLFVGALNMVPYLQIFGTLPAMSLAVITALEKDTSFLPYAGGVALVFVLVQVIQDALITPRIMGDITGLRPVVILFCVLFWGKLLGFLGVLLAIPLTCLGLAYYNRMIKQQEHEFVAETVKA